MLSRIITEKESKKINEGGEDGSKKKNCFLFVCLLVL